MKNAVIWDVTTCDSCKSRVLVTANVPSSLIFTLTIEAIHSSETSGLTRAARRQIAEHCILEGYRSELVSSR
jgi:hypothetical protein